MPALVDDTIVIVLAGGAGERLYPLTKDRAKPAVYFGGPYRIIDFALSNCINSGLRRVFIATQYKSLSLNRHIRMGWSIVSEELGEFVEILPPQKRVSEHFNLREQDLKVRSNTRAIAFPRQVAMYIVKQLTTASLPEIGRQFGGKHHTTVLHSINKIEELRRSDKDLNRTITRLMDALQ